VLIYTAAGGENLQAKGKRHTQNLAYSVDEGVSWNKYAANPVIPHIRGANRDPKVTWHAPSGKWIMALYLEQEYALFASPDLKHWEHLFTFTIPDSTECPDLFELPVDGNSQNTRWIFYGANNSYLIGRFDGKSFTQECAVTGFTAGGDGYAAQSWSGIPPEENRCVQIAWLRLPIIAAMPFSQQMTIPVELSLRSTGDGIRLFAWPIRELECLHRHEHSWQSLSLSPGENPLAGVAGELFDICLDLRLDTAAEIGLVVRGLPVVYDVREQLLSCREKSFHLAPIEGKISLRLLVDRISLEIFANHGQVYLPLGVIFPDEDHSIEIWSKGGSVFIESLEVFELASIWEDGK
ncbi:MAG: glycoside hydrolase family 32 protein, partial [Omnitrophica WOR_2 bacterium]